MRRRLPWILWALAVGLMVPASVANAWLDGSAPVDLLAGVGFTLVALGAATTGALVAIRVPGNAVGWILLVLGAGLGLTIASGAYGEVSATTSLGPLPADEWLAWLGFWLGIPVMFGCTTFLLLLFPDGRLPSPRWRFAAWFAGMGIGLAAVASAFTPGRVGDFANPLAPRGATADLLRGLGTATDLLALPVLLAAAAAMALRLRRSRGVERLQMKWFTYAAALAGLGLGLAATAGGTLADAGFLAGLFALGALPVAAGVAVLRYRLYDIDLVIRRTLIYGALTLTLAGTYLALVLLTGLAVGESDLAIAASTLGVAALIRPARARIQAAVDRRFYRRRYDAARTLEGFGARLRDEIDLDALAADLRGVVRDTVAPAHVSLWLRGER